jgi:hypothetical protein
MEIRVTGNLLHVGANACCGPMIFKGAMLGPSEAWMALKTDQVAAILLRMIAGR